MSFADHFSQTADTYAAARPTYPPALAAWLATLPATPVTAWDAGCGSGQLTRLLAGRFERVIGTDASERQLQNAVTAPGVAYRRARAEASGLAPASVDLTVAAQAAHWFDLTAWYDEVRRVARPGGAVALVSYGLPAIGEPLDALVRELHDATLAPYWPSERRHVVTGYADLPFPFREVDAPPFAMTADWTAARFARYIETWSGVRRLIEGGGGEVFGAFRRALLEAWGDAERIRTVRWPLAVRAGAV